MPIKAPRNNPGTGPVNVPTHPSLISVGVMPTSSDATAPAALAVAAVVADVAFWPRVVVVAAFAAEGPCAVVVPGVDPAVAPSTPAGAVPVASVPPAAPGATPGLDAPVLAPASSASWRRSAVACPLSTRVPHAPT